MKKCRPSEEMQAEPKGFAMFILYNHKRASLGFCGGKRIVSGGKWMYMHGFCDSISNFVDLHSHKLGHGRR